MKICTPCAVGTHAGCSGAYDPRDVKCGCAYCHPNPLPGEGTTVLEIFYALAYAAYTVSRSAPNVRQQFNSEVYTSVRRQFDATPIQEWAKAGRVADVIEAQGEKVYYSRDEVTEALVASGVDMQWAKATPAVLSPTAVARR